MRLISYQIRNLLGDQIVSCRGENSEGSCGPLVILPGSWRRLKLTSDAQQGTRQGKRHIAVIAIVLSPALISHRILSSRIRPVKEGFSQLVIRPHTQSATSCLQLFAITRVLAGSNLHHAVVELFCARCRLAHDAVRKIHPLAVCQARCQSDAAIDSLKNIHLRARSRNLPGLGPGAMLARRAPKSGPFKPVRSPLRRCVPAYGAPGIYPQSPAGARAGLRPGRPAM